MLLLAADMSQGRHQSKADILQRTLDLMVLKTLAAMGPMHGYGLARRIEQLSEDAMQVSQGTIYLCLVAGAEGLDQGGMGHVGEQPAGEVLLDFQSGR